MMEILRPLGVLQVYSSIISSLLLK
jgi:hypothetical protein